MFHKKIKILIDLDSMAMNQKSGVGSYCAGLLEALAKQAGDESIVIGHYFNFLGRSKPNFPKLPNVRYRQTRLIPRQIINLLRRCGIPIFYELLTKARGNFILYPNFIGHRSIFKTPMAPVIHDLTYVDRQQDMTKKNTSDLSRFVPIFINRSHFVIAISESTKQAIIDQYGTSSKKIIVSRMAPPPALTAVWCKPKIKLPSKYILFVGTLEPRKNLINLIEAYSKHLDSSFRKEYGLVIAGGKGWQNQETLSRISKLQAQGLNIVLVGYVDEKTKSYLYENASLFVLPSHYEGFGIPILESMSHGTPVIVSDIPVFHEVAGTAARYFDQNNPKDIARAIESILGNQTVSNQLVASGHENLKKFSWDIAGKKVYNSIKLVVKGLN